MTGETGKQPGGNALTALIKGEFESAEDHIAAAKSVSPAAILLTSALSDNIRQAVSDCLNNPSKIIERRTCARTHLTQVAAGMAEKRQQWASITPEGSPAKAINIPLIAYIVSGLDFRDKDLVSDLTLGVKITGEILATNTLTTRTRVPRSDIESWEQRIPKVNKEVVDRVMGKQGTEGANACRGLSLKEADRGWITHPKPLAPEEFATAPLTPRFANPECHGVEAARKIRLIMDFKMSGANDLITSVDTCIPQGLGVFPITVSYYKLLGPDCSIRAFAEDFPHAYKTVGAPASQARFGTIVLAPPTGPPHTAQLRTQSFGSARAPANWGMVTTFIQHVLARLFG